MRSRWRFLALLVFPLAVLVRGTEREPALTSRVHPPSAESVVADVMELNFLSDAKPFRSTEPERPESSGRSALAFETDPVLRRLIWLAHRQSPDGSWGDYSLIVGHPMDSTGATALALLSFFGAGYSRLSRDTYEGRCLGETVWKGVTWLKNAQRPDGSFISSGDATLNHALAATALSEANGLTGSKLFEEEARRGLEALEAMQRVDGSWGGPVRSVWAAHALRSGDLSGLESRSKWGASRVREYFALLGETAPSLESMAGHLTLNGTPSRTFDPTADLLDRNPPGWSRPDPAYWYLGSVALMRHEGPSGSRFERWRERLVETLSDARGDTADSVIQNALAALALETYSRRCNILQKAP